MNLINTDNLPVVLHNTAVTLTALLKFFLNQEVKVMKKKKQTGTVVSAVELWSDTCAFICPRSSWLPRINSLLWLVHQVSLSETANREYFVRKDILIRPYICSNDVGDRYLIIQITTQEYTLQLKLNDFQWLGAGGKLQMQINVSL